MPSLLIYTFVPIPSELLQHTKTPTFLFLAYIRGCKDVGNNPIMFIFFAAFFLLFFACLTTKAPLNVIVFFSRCRPAALNRFYETKLGERDRDISETANK